MGFFDWDDSKPKAEPVRLNGQAQKDMKQIDKWVKDKTISKKDAETMRKAITTTGRLNNAMRSSAERAVAAREARAEIARSGGEMSSRDAIRYAQGK